MHQTESLDTFETERLLAERLRETHLPDLIRMDQNPSIMANLGGLRSEEGSRKYLQANLDHWARHGFGLWVLRSLVDGAFVGRAYLRHNRLGGSEEVAMGYALMPEFWGAGLATEIAAAMLDLAFSRLRLHDVAAGAQPDHMASRRVMEKVGGQYEKDITYKDRPHVLYRFVRQD